MFGLFTKKPHVRFPPSPTGLLHIGTARTLLFNYLFAKKGRGNIVLRFEDTDRERSKKEFEDDIVSGLTWLGISWDERCRQSERTDLYVKKLGELIQSGKAYVSKEAGKEDQSKIVAVVRLKNPGKKIAFHDLVRGDIETDTTDLGDFVIARSVSDPLYHFAVVVDDGEMGITHVIRGEDHIPNTARQILIQEALGYSRPKYAHLPLILATDRSKMSKRHGATGVAEYRAMGILPEAMINFLALLGWNPGTAQELFTMDELIAAFDLGKLHKSGAVFNMEKLLWFNREYLKKLSDEEYLARLDVFAPGCLPADLAEKMLPLVRERASTLAEARDMASSPEFSFLKGAPSYDAQKLIPKAKEGEELSRQSVREHLTRVIALIEPIGASSFTAEAVKDAIWPYASDVGRGGVLWPMRYALSGSDRSPDPFAISSILGKEETITRLKTAIEKLG